MKCITLLVSLILLTGCRSDRINYSKALFEHIPESADLLVLVRPDDVIHLMEMAATEINFEKVLGHTFQMDAKKLDSYREIGLTMLEHAGVPWTNVESFGYLLYQQQHSFMITGDFKKESVEKKLTELGFRPDNHGYFNYIYGDQKLNVAADGLMILSNQDTLSDLDLIPEPNRLWNRSDFKKYRETSPLDNSLFVWGHPPEGLLSGFSDREILGDVSLAANFRNNLTVRTTVRITDPEKTVMLYNIILGAVTLGKGLMGSDKEMGPLLEAVTVSQDNKEVVASMVIPADQLSGLKKRLIREFEAQDFGTFAKIRSFLDNFK